MWTLQKRDNALYLNSWVLSSDVKLKTLPRKTLVVATVGWALVGKIAFTLPTMHIHRGWEALLIATVGAQIQAILITLICKSHCDRLWIDRHFNFTSVHRRTFGHDFTSVRDFTWIYHIKLDLLSSIRRGKHILIHVERH